MINDEQLRNFLKRIENKFNGNEFLLMYIDKILWNFSISEFLINNDRMDVIDQNNNNLSIVIDRDTNIIITLNKNNYKDCIEVTKDQISVLRSEIINKRTKQFNLKKISYTKLYFDKKGNLEYSDNWEKSALNYDENQTQRITKEQITIYNDQYPCSYIRQKSFGECQAKMSGYIKNVNINLDDYKKYIKDERGCYLAISKLIKRIRNVDFKSATNENNDLILEKIKKIKF